MPVRKGCHVSPPCEVGRLQFSPWCSQAVAQLAMIVTAKPTPPTSQLARAAPAGIAMPGDVLRGIGRSLGHHACARGRSIARSMRLRNVARCVVAIGARKRFYPNRQAPMAHLEGRAASRHRRDDICLGCVLGADVNATPSRANNNSPRVVMADHCQHYFAAPRGNAQLIAAIGSGYSRRRDTPVRGWR